MTQPAPITLFDLQLASGCTISPFVWRVRYALAHKRLPAQLIPGGFTGIAERTGGRSDRLPVIIDQGEWIIDSWRIAAHLDVAYADRPKLFEGPAMVSLTRFLDGWLIRTIMTHLLPNYMLDYHDLAQPQDRTYLRASREARWLNGGRLEDAQAGREARLPLIPPVFDPLRQLLADQPWLGGSAPGYADYATLSSFLWVASIATTPCFADTDPLRDWIERGFDLYGGLGRHPGLHPLFGLKSTPAPN